MKNKKISILIPTYNGHKYITETIQSALNQNYENFEVMVFDDKSTDGTVEVIQKAFGTQVPIHVNNINMGLVKNVNNAVSMCNGEYIMILGQDDILPYNHLNEMIQRCKEDIVLVHCNSIYIDHFGKQGNKSRNDSNQIKRNKNPSMTLCLTNFIQSCGLLIKKETFNKIGGWDENHLHFGEWLSYTAYAKLGKFEYCTKSSAFYRLHQTNLTSHLNKNMPNDLFKYRTKCRLSAFRNLSLFQKLYVLPKMCRKIFKDWTKK